MHVWDDVQMTRVSMMMMMMMVVGVVVRAIGGHDPWSKAPGVHVSVLANRPAERLWSTYCGQERGYGTQTQMYMRWDRRGCQVAGGREARGALVLCRVAADG